MDPPGLQAHSRGIFSLIARYTICKRWTNLPSLLKSSQKQKLTETRFNFSNRHLNQNNKMIQAGQFSLVIWRRRAYVENYTCLTWLVAVVSPRWRGWSCLHATADDPHAKKSCRHIFSRWRGLSSNMVGETHNIGIGGNVQIRPHLLSWVGKNPAWQAGVTLMCEFCTRPLAGLSIWGVFTPSCTPGWRWRALPTCISQTFVPGCSK